MNKYKIEKDTYSGGGLYELEERTTWRVVEISTGNILMEFSGEYSASYNGSSWGDGIAGGVNDVALSEDESEVIVSYSGGKKETVKLSD